MTAKQLTDSILQMAIQGKLVPQDPNDEPASVLLERIKEEKRRLVAEGKLKKKDLEVTAIDEDEIPFVIPESWGWCRLITLCKNIQYGYTASAAPAGNSKLLRITDIQDDNVNWSTVPFCSIKEKDLETYQLHNRDILIARTGGTVGKTYIVRELNETSVFASYLIRAIPLDNISEEYIKLFMGSPYYWSQLTDATTGTGQPNVNGQSLSKLILPLPPLAEQHRIVKRIEEFLPVIKEYGEANDEASKMDAELPNKLKRSILQEAIMGKLGTQDSNDDPASVLLKQIREEKKKLAKAKVLKKKDLIEISVEEKEKPFDIPENWKWVRVSDVVKVIMGQSPDGNDVYESAQKENAYEFHQGKICFTEMLIEPSGKWCKSPSRIAEVNSLLVCVRAPIGDVNITQREIGIGRGLACIKGFCGISTLFLFYWMTAHKRNLIDQGTGSTFKAITVDVLRNQVIPLPPLAEQKRIVEKIESLFAEIDNMTTINNNNEIEEETEKN